MAPTSIRAMVAHDLGIAREWVSDYLRADAGVSVIGVVDGLSQAPESFNRSHADVFVVACSEPSEEALTLVAWAAQNRPDCPVVVLAQESPNGFVRQAFESGADDLVMLPVGADGLEAASREVAFTLQKAVARKPPIEKTDRPGTVICVLGPKGGTGKTLTACNLGVSLADQGNRVVLVDLDLQFGDLALALSLTPESTIYDLAVSGGSLDAEKIEAYMVTHPSGARALLAPVRPDQAGVITIEFLREVYRVLRENYEFVVIDTAPGFPPEVIAAIDASTHVCMIGMLDALSLKNTKLGLETLELMGYDSDRIRLVLNRADSNVGITHSDVVSVLGRPPDVMVPSHRDIARSVNEGKPIALAQKRSEATKAFQGLANIYRATRPAPSGKRGSRSLLTRSKT